MAEIEKKKQVEIGNHLTALDFEITDAFRQLDRISRLGLEADRSQHLEELEKTLARVYAHARNARTSNERNR